MKLDPQKRFLELEPTGFLFHGFVKGRQVGNKEQ